MSRASEAVDRLLAVMARLRGPDGCPWDREQTLSTLRPYVLEDPRIHQVVVEHHVRPLQALNSTQCDESWRAGTCTERMTAAELQRLRRRG